MIFFWSVGVAITCGAMVFFCFGCVANILQIFRVAAEAQGSSTCLTKISQPAQMQEIVRQVVRSMAAAAAQHTAGRKSGSVAKRQ